jgi:hypothetical protein
MLEMGYNISKLPSSANIILLNIFSIYSIDRFILFDCYNQNYRYFYTSDIRSLHNKSSRIRQFCLSLYLFWILYFILRFAAWSSIFILKVIRWCASNIYSVSELSIWYNSLYVLFRKIFMMLILWSSTGCLNPISRSYIPNSGLILSRDSE